MSVTTFWLNLPVKNVEESEAFFEALGFKPNPMHEKAANRAGFFIGNDDVVLMLFSEKDFKQMTGNEVANTKAGTEVLLNIDAESREEVDEMARKVNDAGGSIFSEPTEIQGWMYGLGFEDLDGHRWNMLYMDMSKMPK